MNRAQRRNAAKNNAANFRKAAHATDASIEKRIIEMEGEIKRATQNHFMGLMYCVFIIVLRRVSKYGPKRTLRILSEIAAIINDLENGHISVFDIKRDAEELGCKVVFDESYNIIECGIFEEDKYSGIRRLVDEERKKLYEQNNNDGLRLWSNPGFVENEL